MRAARRKLGAPGGRASVSRAACSAWGPRAPRARRRGAALLAVLWVGALSAMLLIGVRSATQVNLATAHAELASVQAHWLARAGVEQAMAVLQDDDPLVDSPLDLWYRDDGLFNNIELATGTFSVIAPPAPGDDAKAIRYGVHDLMGLVSLNHADADTLTRLPDITPNIAASILDWRDGNGDTRTGGAEAAYYAELPFPYDIANAPFETLGELRLVQGVDPLIFYGEDTNLNGILDPREDDGLLNEPEDDQDGEMDHGLAGLVSVYNYEPNQDGMGTARINVNSASESVLRNQLNLSQALARGVIQARGNNGFSNLMQLLNVQPQQQQQSSRNSNSRGGQQQTQSQSGTSANPNEINSITLDWLGTNLDRLTLDDEERQPGRINVNTASRDVLLSLPAITPDQADAIVEYRDSASGPFDDVGELRTSRTVDDTTWRAIAERVTVRSNVFQITGVGVSRSGVTERIVAVVDRGADPMKVLYWYQGE